MSGTSAYFQIEFKAGVQTWRVFSNTDLEFLQYFSSWEGIMVSYTLWPQFYTEFIQASCMKKGMNFRRIGAGGHHGHCLMHTVAV